MLSNGNGVHKSNCNGGIPAARASLRSIDLELTRETWEVAASEDWFRELRRLNASNHKSVPPRYGNIGARCDVLASPFRRYTESTTPEVVSEESRIVEFLSSEKSRVDDFVSEYWNLKDFPWSLSEDDRKEVEDELKGIKVETHHLGYKRCYKVIGVSRESADKLKFTFGTTDTSVSDYFEAKFNIVLKHPALQCIITGRHDKFNYLPMEVCNIAQDQKCLENKRQMIPMSPSSMTFKEYMYYQNIMLKQKPGIYTSEECAIVHARVLPPPKLKYHDSGVNREIAPRAGYWNMRDKKMYEGAKLERWICLNFSNVEKHTLKRFCKELVDTCSSKGMIISEPCDIIFSGDPKRVEETLIYECMPRTPTEFLQLVIVILPEKPNYYGRIKRICDTRIGIVSQCCKSRHLSKLSKQYLESLALKINVKAGGKNTVLYDAVQKNIPLLTDRPTIIFGADVTHSQPGEPSITAVAASMDWPAVSKYRGLVHAQGREVKTIENLRKCVRDLLKAFCSANGDKKPGRIIFFRNGVSEGQFADILEVEVNMIRQACTDIGGRTYQPKVTFIILQKRRHTRLLTVPDKKEDEKRNIVPGTVVEEGICHPFDFNFYLCSHAGKKGRSRLTHYNVLFDENNFTVDLLQLLINSLCYTFATCTRAVSVVPPAYYAHLLAVRARKHVEDKKIADTEVVPVRVKYIILNADEEETGVIPNVLSHVKNVMYYC